MRLSTNLEAILNLSQVKVVDISQWLTSSRVFEKQIFGIQSVYKFSRGLEKAVQDIIFRRQSYSKELINVVTISYFRNAV